MSTGKSNGECGPHSIGRLLAHINKHTRRYMSDKLESYGIGGPTYGFLFYLYSQDGLTESEITDHMLVDKATTTRAISKLETLGYVKREQSTEDRRAFKVFLTRKALDLKPLLARVREDWVAFVLGDFNAAEKKLFLDYLSRIEERLQHREEKPECEQ
ncbi:MAG: MarR family transcriptional regulator [Candidatus Thermoplasmatota archaeon]|nr:MarR family transcriptional regulator [Candidatus Thermoplasmatota archaeon]